ncbi:hypothetical protein KC957_02650 [Candidatus Saccharibacteria bacterium]|nr:hypothetical protein [Candidatus Saccharibacteria bacterium]
MSTHPELGVWPGVDASGHEQITADPLQGIKEQFEAMSERTPIEWIGKLTDLIPAEQFHGSISPGSRLEAGDITQEQLTRAKEYVGRCYVPTTEGTGIRCVEDRNEVGYNDSDPASYQLGPQIQGATVDIAIATRLARGIEGATDVLADIETAVEENDGTFISSTHTDEAHQAEGEMGCGAQKGQEIKLGYFQDPAHMQSIEGVTRVVFEKAARKVSDQALADLPGSAAGLASLSGYFENLAGAGSRVSELNGGNQQSRKTVEGVHNAAFVVLNLDGSNSETLNPGKLNVYTDGEIMSFGLDVWYILDTYPEEVATDLIADAIATLMNLTDGSLEVGLRLPAEEAPVAA